MPNNTELKAWDFEHGTIRIFDQSGCELDSKSWLIGASDSSFSMRIHPTKISTKLKQSLAAADNNGWPESGLPLTPADAVLLFLEGVITTHHLEAAQVTEDSISVELQVDGRRRRLRINPEAGAL